MFGCASKAERYAAQDQRFEEAMRSNQRLLNSMRPIQVDEFSVIVQAEYDRCNAKYPKNKRSSVLSYATCIEQATSQKLQKHNVVGKASIAAIYERLYRAHRESAEAFAAGKIPYRIHRYNVSAARILIVNSAGGASRSFQPVQGQFKQGAGFYGEFRGWGSGSGDLTLTDDKGRTCIGDWQFSYGNGKGNLLCSDGANGKFSYTATAPRGTESVGSGSLDSGESFTFKLGSLSHTEQYATELARQMVLERNTVTVRHSGRVRVNTSCIRTGSFVSCR